MIRLLTFCLVAAAIRTKAAGSFQTGPSGGESSPFYNFLASSLLSKYPQLNSTTDSAPLTCTCGFCNQRSPPQPPTVLSGVVMFPTSELQQVLRAPVPVPLYAPSPHPPPSPQPDAPPSYIMTIPKKYDPQAPPSSPVRDTYPPPSRNFKYSLPPPPPNPTPPHPYPFPKPPPFASCPATVYFQPTQSLSFNEPSLYSSPPSPKKPPSLTSYPPSLIFPPQSPPRFSPPPPPPPPAPPSPPRAVKEPLVTYTLRASTSPDVLPGTSLEAESQDCSVPTPPVIV